MTDGVYTTKELLPYVFMYTDEACKAIYDDDLLLIRIVRFDDENHILNYFHASDIIQVKVLTKETNPEYYL